MIDKRLLSLGKKPKLDDPRNLKLAKYLKRLPEVPADVSYMARVPRWEMSLNDVLGDCVPAAMAHSTTQWTTYAASDPVVPTDRQVLVAYEAIGGYVPGQPDTDNGCDMLTALKYWRKKGIANKKIAAFVEVDVRNVGELAAAVYLFGNCFFGVQLPLTAQTQDCWEVTDPARSSPNAQPGSWGGHCVPIVGAHEKAFTVVSWGEVLYMTPNFAACYGDEAYAVLSPDWIEQRGVAPSGFDMDALLADLSAL